MELVMPMIRMTSISSTSVNPRRAVRFMLRYNIIIPPPRQFAGRLVLGPSLGALLLAACGPDLPEPKLSSIQEKVFTPSCALSSCHGSSAQAGLSLRAGDSYSELVGVPAEGKYTKDKGWVRVVAGNPNQSLIIKKMEGPGPDLGALMPDVAGQELDPEVIAVIRAWIAKGAPND